MGGDGPVDSARSVRTVATPRGSMACSVARRQCARRRPAASETGVDESQVPQQAAARKGAFAALVEARRQAVAAQCPVARVVGGATRRHPVEGDSFPVARAGGPTPRRCIRFPGSRADIGPGTAAGDARAGLCRPALSGRRRADPPRRGVPRQAGRAAAAACRRRRGGGVVLVARRASAHRAHGRAERAAGHHRHAARRRAGQLRRSGRDPQSRSPGGSRRPLRVRPRPRRGDAAVARQHPHRALSLRARDSRQRGLQIAGRELDAGRHAARRRDSPPVRSSAPFRSTAGSGSTTASTCTTTGSGTRRGRPTSQSRNGRQKRWWRPPAPGSNRSRDGGSPGSTCSIRMPSTARRRPSTHVMQRARITARSPTPTTRSDRCSTSPAPRMRARPSLSSLPTTARPSESTASGPMACSRTRRRCAFRWSLRRSDADWPFRTSGRSRPSRSGTSTSFLRSSMRSPCRHLPRCPAARSSTRRPPRSSRCRTSRRCPPRLTGAGRRCAACWRDGTSTSICPCRSSTTCGPIRSSRATWSRAGRGGCGNWRPCWRTCRRRIRSSGASRRPRRWSNASGPWGYEGGSAPARDIHTRDDDPKRLAHLDDAIHRGVDLYQRGRPREAIEVYREIVAERARSGAGPPAPGAPPLVAGRGGRGRRDAETGSGCRHRESVRSRPARDVPGRERRGRRGGAAAGSAGGR